MGPIEVAQAARLQYGTQRAVGFTLGPSHMFNFILKPADLLVPGSSIIDSYLVLSRLCAERLKPLWDG